MRTSWIWAGFVAAAALAAGAAARGADGCAAAPTCGCAAPAACGCDAGDACGGCGGCGGLLGNLCCLGGHHGKHHKGPRYEGLEPGFNCGCNGSYKFPVPPLYTYHWPGMWQAQLMTDYHSPWRFPPLKPYVDEVPPAALGLEEVYPQLRSVSYQAEAPSAGHSVFSRHLDSMPR